MGHCIGHPRHSGFAPAAYMHTHVAALCSTTPRRYPHLFTLPCGSLVAAAPCVQISRMPKQNGSRGRTVVITQGAQPTVVAANGKVTMYPIIALAPENLVDTNGAGAHQLMKRNHWLLLPRVCTASWVVLVGLRPLCMHARVRNRSLALCICTASAVAVHYTVCMRLCGV